LKINELRQLIEKYPAEELRLIIPELYKAVPKAKIQERNIDDFIKNPRLTRNRSKSTNKEIRDINLIKNEVEQFLEYAYNQYYFAPNRFVHKKDRPKWRFIVKRFYKELSQASGNDEQYLPIASELLEKIYVMLCYSCSYIIFNSFDSFESIRITQEDFYRQVLSLKFQIESKKQFIKNAVELIINNSVNRYTLYSDLMNVFLEFLKTPDLKEMAIETCKIMEDEIKRDLKNNDYDYDTTNKYNCLVEIVFRIYVQLQEVETAIDHFKEKYIERNREIKFYILSHLLLEFELENYFIKEYEIFIKKGIEPRDRLKELYHKLKKS